MTAIFSLLLSRLPSDITTSRLPLRNNFSRYLHHEKNWMVLGHGRNEFRFSLVNGCEPNQEIGSTNFALVPIRRMSWNLEDELLQKIFFQGRYNLNITLDNTAWLSIYPTGMYRFNFTLSTPDRDTFTLLYNIEVNSEIKTSFWFEFRWLQATKVLF